MTRGAYDWLAYNAGWCACVLGAANGAAGLGPAAAAPLLAIHLAAAPDRAAETRLVLLAGGLGFAADSALGLLGVFRWSEGHSVAGLAPPWILALWMLFAATLRSSLAFLQGRVPLAAALGAVAGPIAYVGGAKLGAMSLGVSAPSASAVLAALWAALLPALVRLARPNAPVPAESAA